MRKEKYGAPRGLAELSITKGDDGIRHMLIKTSNSYKDRDHEYISTEALKRYVEGSWKDANNCQTGNELLLWHKGEAIGDIIWCDMEGPFLIEVAEERRGTILYTGKDRRYKARELPISAVWDYIEADTEMPWGASHGFKYEEKLFNFVKGHAVYNDIQKFETSVLPLDNAANPYTFSGVVDMKNRDSLLDKMFGRGTATALRKGVQAEDAALQKSGLDHKSTDNDGDNAIDALLEALADRIAVKAATAVTDPPPPDEPEDDEPKPEGDKGLLAEKQIEALDFMLTAQSELAEQLDEVLTAVKEQGKMTARISDLEKQVKSLNAQLSLRPRRASQADETEIDPDDELNEEIKEIVTDKFWGVKVVKEGLR